MLEHGPEVVVADWLVVLKDPVVEVDVELVCADANEKDVSAARIATVMTAATRIVFLSVLNLRTHFVSPPQKRRSPRS